MNLVQVIQADLVRVIHEVLLDFHFPEGGVSDDGHELFGAVSVAEKEGRGAEVSGVFNGLQDFGFILGHVLEVCVSGGAVAAGLAGADVDGRDAVDAGFADAGAGVAEDEVGILQESQEILKPQGGTAESAGCLRCGGIRS